MALQIVIGIAIIAVWLVPMNFSSESRAKFIATNSWRIKTIVVNRKLVYLELVALTGKRYNRFVGFGENHPDFLAMTQLSEGDFCQFTCLSDPLKELKKGGAARYLRLENAGTIWK